MGNKRIDSLVITANSQISKSYFIRLNLAADSNAFRSTKNYTENIEFTKIDCELLDLSFLSGFEQVSVVEFKDVTNLNRCFPSLPPLPNLSKLSIDDSKITEFTGDFKFPNLSIGLKTFDMVSHYDDRGEMWNDSTISNILDWLLLSSANTLVELNLYNFEIQNIRKLSEVPRQIPHFKALKRLLLPDNKISTIRIGQLSFSVPVSNLDLEDSNIKQIDPGSFQGKFI